MAAKDILRLSGVEKAFKTPDGEDLKILDGVDLSLREDEILVLLGRSGSGKSTLLRIMSGLVPPTGGEVMYRDSPVTGPVPGLSMVFQSFALFPWLTVLENVELGLEARGVPRAERLRRALAAIDLIGLDGFESAYPRELSGGMRQRVGFARALVVDPDVLLMDEAFSALDVLTAENLRTDLLDLWEERQIPLRGILLVSHNIEEAVLMADRIVIFASNPGRVAAEIPVRLPQPRNRQAPEFRRLVEEIYAIMTRRGPQAPRRAEGVSYRLPTAAINRLAGLIEAIDAESETSGQRFISLPELADDMQLSVDDLFPLVESLEILDLAMVVQGQIALTAVGRRYVNGDTQERKSAFARQLLKYVPLAAHIRSVLDERPNHRAPAERFLTELEDSLSDDESQRVLEVVINWGRYAEIFAYDDDAEVLSLEDPGEGESALGYG
ncbi:nitrate ABC transporter ATP-binding protein [Acidihalobacter aeolianus]|uniref:Nitrate ABC transporter ATP-binding protein n=1 Tax=Acidihalobacter aeolianus TaxID=2792603 RepID=A0A1D8KBC1_9GAMM|nr:nitrate/sulfonate/bicarbonate ABC transporter ATP-binding protein [Acidihalobacter aeolianus]AOV18255.1 nitrate ABC transporter ATP-binding protein [Acidihalobacter aeolianus]